MKRGTAATSCSTAKCASRGERIDAPAGARDPHARARACPERRRPFRELTVLENLLAGAFLSQDRNATQRRLERCFALFPRLAERKAQIAGTLSGGEQQMLATARALCSKPSCSRSTSPRSALRRKSARSCSPPSRDPRRRRAGAARSSRKWRRSSRSPTATTCCPQGRILAQGSSAVTDGGRDAARRLSRPVARLRRAAEPCRQRCASVAVALLAARTLRLDLVAHPRREAARHEEQHQQHDDREDRAAAARRRP